MSVRQRLKAVGKLRNNHLICVLENPYRDFNLAAVMRIVCGLGVSRIYIVGGHSSIPKTFEDSRTHKGLLQQSAGASKWTFIRHFDTTQDCINHLDKNNYVSITTSPYIKDKQNISLYDGQFTHKKLAIWFGNESDGLTEEVILNATANIQIPMYGIVESFNLGISVGIVLSFIVEQRIRYMKSKMTVSDTNPTKK